MGWDLICLDLIEFVWWVFNELEVIGLNVSK